MPVASQHDQDFELLEVDFKNLVDCPTIALLGRRRAGKTTWGLRILGNLVDKCNRFMAMCGNRDNIAEWAQVIDPLYVMMKDIAFLQKLRDYQDEKCSFYTLNGQEIPKKYKITIVLDDCGSDKQFMYSKIMKDLLSNGRHYGMTLIILAQYLNQMHTQNRDQLDYLGVLFTANQKNVKKIYEEYASVCKDVHTFHTLLKVLTANRGLCWIDTTINPFDVSECIYYGDVEWPTKLIKVGDHKTHAFSRKHYKEEETPTQRKARKQRQARGEDEYCDSDDDSDDDHNNIKFGNPLAKSIWANRIKVTDRKKGTITVCKTKTKQKIE